MSNGLQTDGTFWIRQGDESPALANQRDLI